MNWLLYIGGWFYGFALTNGIIVAKDTPIMITKILAWTMVWVWFCWRFI